VSTLTDPGAAEAVGNACRALSPFFLYEPDRPEVREALATWKGSAAALRAEWPFVTEEQAARDFDDIEAGLETDADDLGLRAEYARLIGGPQHRVAPPWGSVYTDKDGVVFGATTLELRSWLRAHGIASAYGTARAEDHIGALLDLAGYVADHDRELLAEFLEQHVLMWSHHYFAKLIPETRHPLYRGAVQLADDTLEGVRVEFDLHPRVVRFYR
jgi:TorA maturation chaperone TorD